MATHAIWLILTQQQLKRVEEVGMLSQVHRSNGLTLIELLVTMAILVVMATIAVPSFSTFIQNRKHSAAIADFRSAIAFTRSEAVKRGTPTAVCASSNGLECNGVSWTVGWLAYVDKDANGAKDSNEQVLRINEALDSGYTLLGSTNVATSIRYKPNGDSLETGVITLCDSRGADKAEAIIIAPSGKSKLSQAGAGGATLSCP